MPKDIGSQKPVEKDQRFINANAKKTYHGYDIYRVGGLDYMKGQRYMKVSPKLYPGKDAASSFYTGRGTIISWYSPYDDPNHSKSPELRSYTHWKEVDPNTKKTIDSGKDIFDFVAKEMGHAIQKAENEGRPLTGILAEVKGPLVKGKVNRWNKDNFRLIVKQCENVLGDYRTYQVKPEIVQQVLDNEKEAEERAKQERGQSDAPSQKQVEERVEAARRINASEKQLIKNIQENGSLFSGSEEHPLYETSPMIIHPGDIKNGHVPQEDFAPGLSREQQKMKEGPEKERVREEALQELIRNSRIGGMQYVELMLRQDIKDKRMVYTDKKGLYMPGRYGMGAKGIHPINEHKRGQKFTWIEHHVNKEQRIDEDIYTSRAMTSVENLYYEDKDTHTRIDIYDTKTAKPMDYDKVFDNFKKLYGGLLIDKNNPDKHHVEERMAEAKKDLPGTMRRLIEIHSPIVKDNKHQKGLKVLNRELALDWALRQGCGWKGPIPIPEEDRKDMVDLLRQDVERGYETTKRTGKNTFSKDIQAPMTYFKIAVINMDTQNKGNKEIQPEKRVEGLLRESQNAKRDYANMLAHTDKDIKAAMDKEPFSGLSIVMKSYYKDRHGQEYFEGYGEEQFLGVKNGRKIEGKNAYLLLADMVMKDKEMYDSLYGKHSKSPERKAYTEDEQKKVTFELKLEGQKPVTLSFQPGKMDMGNAGLVSDALKNLMVEKEKNAAFNKTIQDKMYEGHLRQIIFQNDIKKHPGDEIRIDVKDYAKELPKNDKQNYIASLKDEYDRKVKGLDKVLDSFKRYEGKYLGDHKDFQTAMNREADVYRYKVSSQARDDMIFENFGAQNVLKVEQDKKTGEKFISLRNQLTELRTRDEGEVVRDFDAPGQPAIYYDDSTKAQERKTINMMAVPWYTDKEQDQLINLHKDFVVSIEQGEEKDEIRGQDGRDFLVGQMQADVDAYQEEKTLHYRREENLKPYTITVTQEGQKVFEHTGHYGDMSIGNFSSVDELLHSQEKELSEKGKTALKKMDEELLPAQKYSETVSIENSLREKDREEQRTITLVRNSDMKSLEAAEDPEISKVEALDRDAEVNFIKDPQQKTDYMVLEVVEEAKAAKMAPKDYVNEVFKDEMKDKVKGERIQKSLESKKVREAMGAKKKINIRPKRIRNDRGGRE